MLEDFYKLFNHVNEDLEYKVEYTELEYYSHQIDNLTNEEHNEEFCDNLALQLLALKFYDIVKADKNYNIESVDNVETILSNNIMLKYPIDETLTVKATYLERANYYLKLLGVTK